MQKGLREAYYYLDCSYSRNLHFRLRPSHFHRSIRCYFACLNFKNGQIIIWCLGMILSSRLLYHHHHCHHHHHHHHHPCLLFLRQYIIAMVKFNSDIASNSTQPQNNNIMLLFVLVLPYICCRICCGISNKKKSMRHRKECQIKINVVATETLTNIIPTNHHGRTCEVSVLVFIKNEKIPILFGCSGTGYRYCIIKYWYLVLVHYKYQVPDTVFRSTELYHQ